MKKKKDKDPGGDDENGDDLEATSTSMTGLLRAVRREVVKDKVHDEYTREEIKKLGENVNKLVDICVKQDKTIALLAQEVKNTKAIAKWVIGLFSPALIGLITEVISRLVSKP